MISKRRFLALGGVAAGIAALKVVPAAAQGAPATMSTFDRVRTTKVVRISTIVGAEPYFRKDLATGGWSGVGIEMAKDIAKSFEAKLEYVESTYANAIVDLKSGRTDIAFSLNPTPERALSIDFTHPYYMHPYVFLGKAGLKAKTWADINRPDFKVSASIGTLPDVLVKRYAPKAQLVSTKTIDEAVMSVQSGRSNCIITAALQALSIKGKNPLFSTVVVPSGPRIALPTCLGIHQEADLRWVNYLNAWIDFNRASGQIMNWINEELTRAGIKLAEIPQDV